MQSLHQHTINDLFGEDLFVCEINLHTWKYNIQPERRTFELNVFNKALLSVKNSLIYKESKNASFL